MNKRRILISVLALVIFCVSAFFIKESISAKAIAQCQVQIEENNIQINTLEKIKNQLHVTAELLRNNEDINNGFDVILSQKWYECNEYQNSKNSENIELKNKINVLQNEEKKKIFIGDFKITHYCICSKCCGKSPTNPTYGITATGTLATAGRTIAVDPKKIPYGTKVVIDGHTYVAEDCGGAIKGNRIDICVSSHTEAYQRGVRNDVPVYLIEE